MADGSQDVVEPPGNSRIIARRIPRARLRLFPDSGHAFMFQYHDAFSRLAVSFLAAGDTPRTPTPTPTGGLG